MVAPRDGAGSLCAAGRLLLLVAAAAMGCGSRGVAAGDGALADAGGLPDVAPDDTADGPRTAIAVSPSALSFVITQNVQPRESQLVSVTFRGDGVVVGYASAVSPPAWLTVAQAGPATPGAVAFSVTADASALSIGEYATSIRFATGLLPPSGDLSQATDVVFADVPVSLGVIVQVLTVEEFCAAKARAECQAASRCLTPVDACEARRDAACLQLATAAVSAARPFRSENAAACLRATEVTYGKTAPITPVDMALLDDACGQVFQGDVAAGGPCTTRFDCSSGDAICDKGRCAIPVAVPAGAACADPGQVCATGSTCALAPAGDPVCTPKRTLGDACDAANPCLEPLRCAGTCQSRLPQGSRCTSDDDCAGGAPYCDPYVGNLCDGGLVFAPGAPSCAFVGG